MKAFQTVEPDSGCTSIVYHESASKARYATYRAAGFAGWTPRLIDIVVRRCPDMDAARLWGDSKPEQGRCYAREAFAKELS